MTHVFPSKDTPLQRSFPGQRPNTALNRATGTARNGAKPPVEGQGGRTAQEGSPGWRAAASRPHHASWAGTRGHHLSRAYRTHRAANPPRNRNQGFLETRANTAQPPPAHSLLLTPLPSGDMLHRRNVSPAPGPRDKLRRLEERLSSQERTTAFLLHQAFRLKDDIVSYLQESTGYQHRETAARQLLENHVQTIAGMVQKLCQDIEVLERQIRTRDGATAQTNFAVQSLDHKHIQSLGDLRGRVARCEASIAKLSGDISIIRHEVQKIDKEICSLHSTLKYSVMQLLGKIEASNPDQSSNLKTVQGDQHHKLQLLDFKLTSILSDFKDQMQHQQKWTEAQLTRSEDQAQHRHQLLNAMKERLEAAEKKIDEKLLLLSLKLEQTEKPEEYKQELNQMRSDENNLHARITRFERQIWKELEEIQNEYRSGFQSIHESLELLKQIQNAKLKLEKKKMKKDTQRYKASDLP
ncbi:protein FAM81B isoform X2 [Anas platyrhynchos]|uniref:protein FAM81B isoform X2 n=1 Tax=Anas platyrhynchos TaxID=8839 RepID=UPI003AF2EBD8